MTTLFDGVTYSERFDLGRLANLTRAVYDVMQDGRWRTLPELHSDVGFGMEASISARLRDLRKEKFGGFTVERRRRGEPKSGLWEYRLHAGR